MRKVRLMSMVFVLVASVAGAGNYLSFVEIHSDETSLDYFKAGSVNGAGTVVTAVGTAHFGATYSRNPSTGEVIWVEDSSSVPKAVCVADVPPGRFLYLATFYDDSIEVLDRSLSGGITQVQTLSDGVDGVDGLETTMGVCVSHDGKNVYAVGRDDDAVATFRRNPSDGSLTFIDVIFDTDGGVDGLDGANVVAISPDDAFVYVGSTKDDAIAVFSRNSSTGILSWSSMISDSDSGVSGLGYPNQVVIPGNGNYLYQSGSALVVLARDAGTGALSFVESHAVPFSYAMATDPTSDRIFVASGSGDNVIVFEADPATGMLTQVDEVVNDAEGITGLDAPSALFVSPDGASLYVGTELDQLLVFSIGIFGGDFEDGNLAEWSSVSK